jgi:hypothetical protein
VRWLLYRYVVVYLPVYMLMYVGNSNYIGILGVVNQYLDPYIYCYQTTLAKLRVGSHQVNRRPVPLPALLLHPHLGTGPPPPLNINLQHPPVANSVPPQLVCIFYIRCCFLHLLLRHPEPHHPSSSSVLSRHLAISLRIYLRLDPTRLAFCSPIAIGIASSSDLTIQLLPTLIHHHNHHHNHHQ